MSKMDIISQDFITFALIRKGNIEKQPYYHKKLVKKLKGIISPNRISVALDRLFDLGLINANWEKVDKIHWARTYYVAGEGTRLADEILEYIKEEL